MTRLSNSKMVIDFILSNSEYKDLINSIIANKKQLEKEVEIFHGHYVDLPIFQSLLKGVLKRQEERLSAFLERKILDEIIGLEVEEAWLQIRKYDLELQIVLISVKGTNDDFENQLYGKVLKPLDGKPSGWEIDAIDVSSYFQEEENMEDIVGFNQHVLLYLLALKEENDTGYVELFTSDYDLDLTQFVNILRLKKIDTNNILTNDLAKDMAQANRIVAFLKKLKLVDLDVDSYSFTIPYFKNGVIKDEFSKYFVVLMDSIYRYWMGEFDSNEIEVDDAFTQAVMDILKTKGYEHLNIEDGNIISIRDRIKYIFVCIKASEPIGEEIIDGVDHAMHDAHVVVIVSNATFTKEAKRLAQTVGIVLWDGAYIHLSKPKPLGTEQIKKRIEQLYTNKLNNEYSFYPLYEVYACANRGKKQEVHLQDHGEQYFVTMQIVLNETWNFMNVYIEEMQIENEDMRVFMHKQAPCLSFSFNNTGAFQTSFEFSDHTFVAYERDARGYKISEFRMVIDDCDIDQMKAVMARIQQLKYE